MAKSWWDERYSDGQGGSPTNREGVAACLAALIAVFIVWCLERLFN